MYHVSAQGVDERMINVHYYYYYLFLRLLSVALTDATGMTSRKPLKTYLFKNTVFV